MTRPRAFILVGSVLLTAPCALFSQDSQFGIQGLGHPGQFASVRARGTGGAFALFDPFSPAGEAALGDLGALVAGVTTAPSWRRLDYSGSGDGSTFATRFPLAFVAAPIQVRQQPRFVVATGFTTYLDRSYRIATSRPDTIRGVPLTVTDTLASQGAVVDLRVAGAWRASHRVRLGLAAHRLVGSTREAVGRTFSDSTMASYSDSNDVGYEGWGLSLGAVVNVAEGLTAAVTFRTDGTLTADTREGVQSRADLPVTLGGGVSWAPGERLRVAAAGTWRSWSVADAAAQANGGRAFDTFQWHLGAEVGRSRPVRLGLRGGTLPFSPTGEQAREWALAAGTTRAGAGGHALFDVAVERAVRSGPGLDETVWTLLLGVTIRP